MKERPILFSGAMVRALLDGRKTQTRRIVKPQPVPHDFGEGGVCDAFVHPQTIDGMVAVGARVIKTGDTGYLRKLPYGTAGDRLWVKETFRLAHKTTIEPEVIYKASNPEVWGAPWTPSIFMRREYSRLTLEITNVRVERLQDISEEDAWAEGCSGVPKVGDSPEHLTARQEYKALWDSINGLGSWNKNPWCWCITFKRV